MPILGGIICAAIGMILLFSAVLVFLRTRRVVSRMASATGEVVALVEDPTESLMYAPRIRFTAFDGAVVEFTDSTYSNMPSYKLGDRANVLYERNDYTRARLGTNLRLHLTAAVLACLGAIFFGSALVQLFFYFLAAALMN